MGQLPLAGAGSRDFEQPVTIMQRLQAERRKRFLEYQQKLMNGEEWPGFNIPPQHESTQLQSLWDSNVPSNEPWSTHTNSPPRPNVSSSAFWDSQPLSTTNPTSGTWSQPTSIWSTGNPGGAELGMDGAAGGTGNSTPEPQQGGAAVGGFDPFNMLGSIWRPTSIGSGWGFPPKPDDDKN